jgi:hypothetical protein
MEKLIAKTRTMTTDQILEAITIIGGGHLTTEISMVRAALIEVYGEREGDDAADALMDMLGM